MSVVIVNKHAALKFDLGDEEGRLMLGVAVKIDTA